MPITRRPLPRAAVSRAWLDVPYSDRHLVKKLGALWDPASRRRYAPVPGLPALRPWRRLPQSVPGEDRGYGQGLYADPIPASSWYRNVRSAVSARDWDRISQMTRPPRPRARSSRPSPPPRGSAPGIREQPTRRPEPVPAANSAPRRAVSQTTARQQHLPTGPGRRSGTSARPSRAAGPARQPSRDNPPDHEADRDSTPGESQGWQPHPLPHAIRRAQAGAPEDADDKAPHRIRGIQAGHSASEPLPRPGWQPRPLRQAEPASETSHAPGPGDWRHRGIASGRQAWQPAPIPPYSPSPGPRQARVPEIEKPDAAPGARAADRHMAAADEYEGSAMLMPDAEPQPCAVRPGLPTRWQPRPCAMP